MIRNCRGGTVTHIMADGRVIEDIGELEHYLDDHKLPDAVLKIIETMIWDTVNARAGSAGAKTNGGA